MRVKINPTSDSLKSGKKQTKFYVFLLELERRVFSNQWLFGPNDAIKQLVRFPGLFKKVKYTFVCGSEIHCNSPICYSMVC